MKNTLFRLILLTIILLIVSIIFAEYAPEKIVSQGLIYLPGIFLIITLITKYITFRGGKLQQDKLLTNYMISIGVKFGIFIGILITYSLIWPHDSVKFILSFFIFYLIYNVFDLVLSFKLFKGKK